MKNEERKTSVFFNSGIEIHCYARYRTEDGAEVEGLLSNPRSDLAVGQPVRLKYHPKHRTNARLI